MWPISLPIVLLGDFNAHFNYDDTSLPNIESKNNPTQITPSGEAILALIISDLNVKWFAWLFCFVWYSQSNSQLWYHCIIYGNLYCHEQKPKSFERDLEIVYIALTPNADWNDLFDAALHCHKQRVIIEGVHFD